MKGSQKEQNYSKTHYTKFPLSLNLLGLICIAKLFQFPNLFKSLPSNLSFPAAFLPLAKYAFGKKSPNPLRPRSSPHSPNPFKAGYEFCGIADSPSSAKIADSRNKSLPFPAPKSEGLALMVINLREEAGDPTKVLLFSKGVESVNSFLQFRRINVSVNLSATYIGMPKHCLQNSYINSI